jgi:IS30 family transposase
MLGHGSKFARKREEAIAALLSQSSHEAAARAIGISTKTLTRWLKRSEFQEAYREARRAAFAQSVARLQQASSVAATILLKVMVDANAPAACRLRAATSVLTLGLKAIEVEDLEVRVAKLEQATRSGSAGSTSAGFGGTVTKTPSARSR